MRRTESHIGASYFFCSNSVIIADMGKGIYGTGRWLRLRERILRRDGYLCQVSKRYGKLVEATTVHHIFPAADYPEYQWCSWNLISVCANVHNSFHDRETNALTDEGMRLLRKTARAQKILLDPPARSPQK